MERDISKLVEEGYDRVAGAYLAWREEEPFFLQPELLDLSGRLPANARVLDVGCGAGVPLTHFLSQRFMVTGVDLSAQQLVRARQRVPRATFLQQDMLALDVQARSFDAVTSFYSIIHVPRDRHGLALANMRRALKPGGLLLIMTGNEDLAGDIDDFYGAEMYWSHFDRETSLETIRNAGFEVIWEKIIPDRPSGAHLLVLAQERGDATAGGPPSGSQEAPSGGRP
jgi:ubiquinone/menaquinone biosynthesis C-methylase UbiE